MRGFGLFSIVLFIAGFTSLLVAVFIVLNSENMAGKKAQEMSEKVLLDLANVVADNQAIKEAIQKYNQANDSDYQKVMDQTLKIQSEYEKIKMEQDKIHQKINWVEVKMSAQSQKPTKIILSQEAPLKVSMIYKKLQKKTPEQIQRQKLIQKTKTQVQELSK
jgi:long-subunit acyl-CoA synthetase (AMP-forming)